MAAEADRRVTEVVVRERSRLWRFIRRRVPDRRDAEDILQDVFAELVEANRLLMPIDHVTAWLFRVARNRITDWFRKKRPVPLSYLAPGAPPEQQATIDDLLPSPEAGPDALYTRGLLVEALVQAIERLPPAERDVFVAHEIDGRSFKEVSERTGVGVNTLLSRKHSAVRRLRRELHDIYDEFKTK
jgi:RNA polymerase sigma factor (sigma-70 family)